jgi:hypothetical protein
MLRAECLLRDRQGALQKWSCTRQIALVMKKVAETAEAGDHIRMIGAEFCLDELNRVAP